MKLLRHALIFVLSALLTVACGGGGGGAVSSTTTNDLGLNSIQHTISALSAAFVPVAF
jgi:hypothetical protein